jgi:5-bromo-4-chloroindolyl phosphate hydrolysis protein
MQLRTQTEEGTKVKKAKKDIQCLKSNGDILNIAKKRTYKFVKFVGSRRV